MGGAELCFVELLRVLKRSEKYELHAVFPLHEGSLVELCTAYCEDASMHFLPRWIDDGNKYSFVEKLKRLSGIFSSSRKAYRLIKQVNADIVITNTSVIPEFAFAARLANKKHVWFIHELVDEDFGCHYIYGKRLSKKLISWFSDMVITNSKFVNSRYEHLVEPEKLVMLYQPVEISVDKTEVLKESKVLELLIVGKLSEYKGQREAILACNELYNQGIPFHLVIVGVADKTYIEELTELLVPEVCECVEFISFTNDIGYYYQRADIALVCSRCEALGRITIEAMKIGLPVVASDRGGNLELVEDGVNGYLYKQGNSVDLADKIKLLRDSSTRTQFGKNGKRFADENFSLIGFGKKFENLIQLVVDKK
jgi:glycosyltransferase involved in cell wall biosynthesis